MRPGARHPPNMPALRFGPFTLDSDTGRLSRDGDAVPLPAQPMRALTLLVTRAGSIVYRRGGGSCFVREFVGDGEAQAPAVAEGLVVLVSTLHYPPIRPSFARVRIRPVQLQSASGSQSSTRKLAS